MPWTTKDVDKHKKGLSAEQKKAWVATANGVLAECIKNGGSDETCAGKAIRIANSKVGNNAEAMIHVSVHAEDYQVARRKFNGKDYLVLPVVMMVEGVHRGNQGAVYHSIAELGKIPETWNGIPIVIDHPQKDGVAVSANSPDILEESSVGEVFETFVEDNKLKAMAWLEELKLQEISVDLYNSIMDGEAIEVSVGVFTDNEISEGKWNDEDYVAIAKNHRPDHLALLPEAVGACSLADGCGLGVNESKAVFDQINKLAVQGFAIHKIGINGKAGFKEKMEAVYTALRAMETDKSYMYLEEMYDDSLIYSKNTGTGVTMYKQDYKFESGKIELVGDPVEVHRKVEYIVNTSINLNNEEVIKMAETKKCPKCLEKVNALIANEQSKFTEDNREWLMTLEEGQLDLLAPTIVEKEVEKVVEKTIEINKLSAEDQAALAFGKKQLKDRRESWVKGIQSNTETGLWTDEKLNKMDDETLEGIYKSVVKVEEGDFSLNNGRTLVPVDNKEEPMPPTGVTFKTEK